MVLEFAEGEASIEILMSNLKMPLSTTKLIIIKIKHRQLKMGT